MKRSPTIIFILIMLFVSISIHASMRTVVFMNKDTASGQDIFIRGGHDDGLVPQFFPSMSESISYNNLLNSSTASLKSSDSSLDWGSDSAMDWTTDNWPSSWGTKKTYAINGYGEDPENRWGHHWWKFDVMMTGEKGEWFEFKGVLREGSSTTWEKSINQTGTPYKTYNHWGKKGYITRCEFGSSWVEYIELESAQEIETAYISQNTITPGSTVTVKYFGTYKNSDNLTIHYGFNGWNYCSDAINLTELYASGNSDYYKEKSMSQLSGGGFQASFYVPKDARSIHYVFYWNDGGDKKWDTNNGDDWGAAVVFPFIGPYLTWNHNTSPNTGIVINYQTASPCNGRVEYGKTSSLGYTMQGTVKVLNHHFQLTGLEANTDYYYRVSDDKGNTSSVYSFKTGGTSVNDLKYIVLADMQDNGDDRRWKDIADEVHAHHSDADFILVAGDMPWDDKPGHWWTFFDKGRELFASKVIMPALGNHDTPTTGSNADSSTFRKLFDLPLTSGSETYYSFSYGPAKFMVFNSEIPSEFDKDSGVQYSWAQQQISSIWSGGQKQFPWVFAYWHIPPYDVAARHYTQQGSFRDVTKLFDGTVDWVFAGHEHLYHRIKPMRYNAWVAPSGGYGEGSSDGVGYLVVPPAGNYPANEIIHYTWSKSYYRGRMAFLR